MKVTPARSTPQVSSPPFRQLLNEAKAALRSAPPLPSARPAAPPPLERSLAATVVPSGQEARRLAEVRSAHANTAASLAEVRAERNERLTTHAQHRLIELIRHELEQSFSPPPQPSVLQQAMVTSPEAHAAQAAALIEKIEVFVRGQRPVMALTLNNSLGARVEIEKVGPREVALKVVGHRGPPSPEAVGTIREALRARGLKVGALSVA